MGCHTWFYSKLKEVTEDDLDEIRLDLAYDLEMCAKYPTFEDWKRMKKEFADDYREMYHPENMDPNDPETKGILKLLDKCDHPSEKEWQIYNYIHVDIPARLRRNTLDKDQIIKLYKEHGHHGGVNGYLVRKYYDKFRTGDYNTPTFRNLKKATEYVKSHVDKFYVPHADDKATEVDTIIKICEQFFEEHPHGWIEFG